MTNKLIFDADNYARKTYKAINALFDIPGRGVIQTVDTLTDIVNGAVEAKYYELAGQTPSDFLNIDVGRGAYSTGLFQFTTAYVGSTFKECLINPASNAINANANSSIAIDGITIPNNFYAQRYAVRQEAIKMAARNAVNFDIVEQNEKARAKTYQLGFQETMFLGLGDGRTYGLLNQPNVTVNTSLLPTAPEKMTTEQIKTFAATALATSFAGSNYTIMPNRWCMPTRSFMALGIPYGDTFGMPTVKEVLEKAFKEAGAPADFKIVHTVYNNTAASNGKGRHVFYNTDVDNIVMCAPLVYTPHPLYAQGSLDLISDAEAQFTGVWVKREGSILYADEQA